MIRIRSEHAIGFLKGRFQSLKELCLEICDDRSHKFATYWIAACVGIHSFAMQCEADERGGDHSDADEDFILYAVGGMQYVLKERRGGEHPLGPSRATDALIKTVGDYITSITDIVWVYDAYWQQSRSRQCKS